MAAWRCGWMTTGRGGLEVMRSGQRAHWGGVVEGGDEGGSGGASLPAACMRSAQAGSHRVVTDQQACTTLLPRVILILMGLKSEVRFCFDTPC